MARIGAVFEDAWGGLREGGWQVHAYCLMGNHFHLVVETPQPTLVAGMEWFFAKATRRGSMRATGCVGILRADIGSIMPYYL